MLAGLAGLAVNAGFDLLGEPALLTPAAGGPALPVRVLPDRGDVDMAIPGLPVVSAAGQFKLRRSEHPDSPMGARLELPGRNEVWRVKAVTSTDTGRMIWSVKCEAVRP